MKRTTTKGVWTNAVGKKILMSKMTDAHLANAAKVCQKLQRHWSDLEFQIAEELDRRESRSHVDILDDCVVGGCDHYGSIG